MKKKMICLFNFFRYSLFNKNQLIKYGSLILVLILLITTFVLPAAAYVSTSSSYNQISFVSGSSGVSGLVADLNSSAYKEGYPISADIGSAYIDDGPVSSTTRVTFTPYYTANLSTGTYASSYASYIQIGSTGAQCLTKLIIDIDLDDNIVYSPNKIILRAGVFYSNGEYSRFMININTATGQTISSSYIYMSGGATITDYTFNIRNEYDGVVANSIQIIYEYTNTSSSANALRLGSISIYGDVIPDGSNVEDIYQDGYNKGYNAGYSKGTSEALVKNFFGNMFGGIVSAIDSIRFYEETISDNGTPDDPSDDVVFYISVWSIFCTLVILAVIIALLKVWRGG